MVNLNWKTSETIEDLIEELNEITGSMSNEEKNHWWDCNGSNLPVSKQYNELVSKKSSYPIWACNDDGFCLVGAAADEIEHIEDITN